jgi:hypothetical protein
MYTDKGNGNSAYVHVASAKPPEALQLYKYFTNIHHKCSRYHICAFKLSSVCAAAARSSFHCLTMWTRTNPFGLVPLTAQRSLSTLLCGLLEVKRY